MPLPTKVLITGATGFVGSHVLKRLLSDETTEILLLSRKAAKSREQFSRIQWIESDLSNIESYKSEVINFNPDVCIHLSWQGIPDFSASMCTQNLLMACALIDLLLDCTVCRRIIVSGSCFEYGKTSGVCEENDAVIVSSFFSWAKNAINKYLELRCKDKKVDWIWFRIFYVYGPGQRKESLLPAIINSFRQGELPNIKSPLSRNDFIYVDDVAEVFYQASVYKEPLSGIYNLGSGFSTTIYDLCQRVASSMEGVRFLNQLYKNNTLNEPTDFFAQMDKTFSTFRFKTTAIDEGINEVIKHTHEGNEVA